MTTTHWLTSWNTDAGYSPDLPVLGAGDAWEDATGQAVEQVEVAPDLYVIRARLSDDTLTVWRADNRVVELTDTLSAELETALEALYHADMVALVTDSDDAPADALIAVSRRPPWQPGLSVQADDVFMYERNLYRVVQAHTTAAEWPPDLTPALWKRFYEPEAGPQPWVQPLGSLDAYQIGDRVTHNGATWESTVANNVWEPSVYGWIEI